MTTLDNLLLVRDIPKAHDSLEHVSIYKYCLGGKGMITALTLFHLGCDVSTYSLVGTDTVVKDYLPSKFNKDFLCPYLSEDNKTWILVSTQQEVVTLVKPSPLVEGPLKEEAFKKLNRFMSNIDILYISTEYIPLIRKAIELAKKREVLIVSNLNTPFLFDPEVSNGKTFFSSIVEASHTVILNRLEERQLFTKTRFSNWTGVSSQQLEEVIVTNAEEGGAFSSSPFNQWFSYEPVVPDIVLCSVGAGDTFNGAFLYARFIKKLSLQESCDFAADLAAKKLATFASSIEFKR